MTREFISMHDLLPGFSILCKNMPERMITAVADDKTKRARGLIRALLRTSGDPYDYTPGFAITSHETSIQKLPNDD